MQHTTYHTYILCTIYNTILLYQRCTYMYVCTHRALCGTKRAFLCDHVKATPRTRKQRTGHAEHERSIEHQPPRLDVRKIND